MKKGLLLALLPLMALAMTACGGENAAQTGAQTDTVYVENGVLVVALEGNPTTGYEWSQDGELTCLSGGEREYTKHPATDMQLGTGGVYTFRFEPVAAGRQTLHFVYARDWEPDTPAEEYTLTVTVTETKKGYEMTWE